MNILSSVAVSSWIWWMAILLSQSQEVCQQYLKSEWLAGGLMLLKLGLLEGLSLQYENWQNHTPIKCCSIFTSYYREKVGASGTRVPKGEFRPRIESIQLSLSLWIRTKVNITFCGCMRDQEALQELTTRWSRQRPQPPIFCSEILSKTWVNSHFYHRQVI